MAPAEKGLSPTCWWKQGARRVVHCRYIIASHSVLPLFPSAKTHCLPLSRRVSLSVLVFLLLARLLGLWLFLTVRVARQSTTPTLARHISTRDRPGSPLSPESVNRYLTPSYRYMDLISATFFTRSPEKKWSRGVTVLSMFALWKMFDWYKERLHHSLKTCIIII